MSIDVIYKNEEQQISFDIGISYLINPEDITRKLREIADLPGKRKLLVGTGKSFTGDGLVKAAQDHLELVLAVDPENLLPVQELSYPKFIGNGTQLIAIRGSIGDFVPTAYRPSSDSEPIINISQLLNIKFEEIEVHFPDPINVSLIIVDLLSHLQINGILKIYVLPDELDELSGQLDNMISLFPAINGLKIEKLDYDPKVHPMSEYIQPKSYGFCNSQIGIITIY